MAADAPQKMIHSLILDTGPLIKNAVSISTIINSAEEIFTTPAIISEIRDEATRSRVQTTLMPFLKIRNPSPASYDAVIAFSKKTGDHAVLSRQDLGILALAYEVHCERNGGAWGLREAPKQPLKMKPGEDQSEEVPAEDQSTEALGEYQNQEVEQISNEVVQLNTEEKPNEDMKVDDQTNGDQQENTEAEMNDPVHTKQAKQKTYSKSAPRKKKSSPEYKLMKEAREKKKQAKAIAVVSGEQLPIEQQSESTTLGGTNVPTNVSPEEQNAGQSSEQKAIASDSVATEAQPDAVISPIIQDQASQEQESTANQGQASSKIEGTQGVAIEQAEALEPQKVEETIDGAETAQSDLQATPAEAHEPVPEDLAQDLSTLNISTPPSPPDTDNDDSDGEWITPSNLTTRQAADAGVPQDSATTAREQIDVATMTIDFAMQNVLLQMNLHLLSTNMQRIRTLTSKVLRCHACFNIVKQLDKQFCPRCGGASLRRVSCSTDAKGEFKIHLAKNYQWNKRGDKYSVPKPIAGTANGKWSGQGGGQGGWGRDLILAEDQKEYVRQVEQDKRAKGARDLMDDDYLPGILTGDRSGGRTGGRPKVGAGRNVNSKKR
jgi:RNA-binding protein NOB1